ncbi:hypothetical protein RB195_003256 [Necator americanus]|uniref:Uncharacterized protein n=1 Tax=Necator americanus TaxID=51031 RepID=A0ABR1DNC9_NECAM
MIVILIMTETTLKNFMESINQIPEMRECTIVNKSIFLTSVITISIANGRRNSSHEDVERNGYKRAGSATFSMEINARNQRVKDIELASR